jgi:hypothetical protein
MIVKIRKNTKVRVAPRMARAGTWIAISANVFGSNHPALPSPQSFSCPQKIITLLCLKPAAGATASARFAVE